MDIHKSDSSLRCWGDVYEQGKLCLESLISVECDQQGLFFIKVLEILGTEK